MRYSFNFSTGYGKQGIIFLNFFSSVQSLFSCVVPLWVLFYIYGFIVCESVILALARKEKIIASSVFRIRLFQKSDHLFCRGKRFMKLDFGVIWSIWLLGCMLHEKLQELTYHWHQKSGANIARTQNKNSLNPQILMLSLCSSMQT